MRRLKASAFIILIAKFYHLLITKHCHTLCKYPSSECNLSAPFVLAVNNDIRIFGCIIKIVQIIVWTDAVPKHICGCLKLIVTSPNHTF